MYRNGVYTAKDVQEIINIFREKYNEVFNTQLTEEQFQLTPDGNSFYIISQYVANLEYDIANLNLSVEEYIKQLQLKIDNPPTTTNSIIQAFVEEGYTVGLKETLAEGSFLAIEKPGIVLADNKNERDKIAVIYNDHLAGGITTNGSLQGDVELVNQQIKAMNFSPFDEVDLYIQATIEYLSTTRAGLLTENEIKKIILDNYQSKYMPGAPVKPDRWLTFDDIKFADNIIVKYSLDGITYIDAILNSEYNKKYILNDERLIVDLIEV